MPAMLNLVVCVAFHPCWRAVPRGNRWRLALCSRGRLAAWRGDKLQRYDAMAYDWTLDGSLASAVTVPRVATDVFTRS